MYSVFILHSKVFQSVISLWFFISSEVFHVKNPVFIVFFSHSTLWFIFCFWYHWLLGHTCWMEEIWSDLSMMIHWMSLIILLSLCLMISWSQLLWVEEMIVLLIYFEECWSICMCFALINCWESVDAYILTYGCYVLLKSCWKKSFLTLR